MKNIQVSNQENLPVWIQDYKVRITSQEGVKDSNHVAIVIENASEHMEGDAVVIELSREEVLQFIADLTDFTTEEKDE